MIGAVSSLWNRAGQQGFGTDPAARDRIRHYIRYRAAYDGYTFRNQNNVITQDAKRQMVFNFGRPICHTAAGWLAGEPLAWQVSTSGQPNEERISEHLDRIECAISEISETPKVAFGKVDSGFKAASGISLKVLYGPLKTKTMRKRAQWGPSLEYAMYLALTLEGHVLQPQDVDALWTDPTPASDMETMQAFAIKKTLGVSTPQILKELGYDSESIQQMEQEMRSHDSATSSIISGFTYFMTCLACSIICLRPPNGMKRQML